MTQREERRGVGGGRGGVVSVSCNIVFSITSAALTRAFITISKNLCKRHKDGSLDVSMAQCRPVFPTTTFTRALFYVVFVCFCFVFLPQCSDNLCKRCNKPPVVWKPESSISNTRRQNQLAKGSNWARLTSHTQF